MSAVYKWHIDVRRKDAHGGIVSVIPAVIHATDRAEVTTKVLAAFNATYDDFRQFWSHDWLLREVREIGGAAS